MTAQGSPERRIRVWTRNGQKLTEAPPREIRYEELLHQWVESDPSFLGRELLIVGSQIRIAEGCEIDILAIDALGELHGFELKRGTASTPVTDQLVRYYHALTKLTRAQLLALHATQSPSVTLEQRYFRQFGRTLPDVVNAAQSLTLLATGVSTPVDSSIQALRAQGMRIMFQAYRYLERVEAPSLAIAPGIGHLAQLPPAAADPHDDLVDARIRELHTLVETLHHRINDFWSRPPTPTAMALPEDGRDPHVLCFWLLYSPRFRWGFVPSSFLFQLYNHWRCTEAAAGVTRPEYEPKEFGRRLARAVRLCGGWKYGRDKPRGRMDVYEPLTELVPSWKRKLEHENVDGYARENSPEPQSTSWTSRERELGRPGELDS